MCWPHSLNAQGALFCDEVIVGHVTKTARPQVTELFPHFWRDRKIYLVEALSELHRFPTDGEQEVWMRKTRADTEQRIRLLFGQRRLYFHFLSASPEQIAEVGGVLTTHTPGDSSKAPVLYYFDGNRFALTDLISHQVARGRPVLVLVDAENEYFRQAEDPATGRGRPIAFSLQWLEQNSAVSSPKKKHRDFEGRYIAIPNEHILNIPVDYLNVELPSDIADKVFQSSKYKNELLRIAYVEYVLSQANEPN